MAVGGGEGGGRGGGGGGEDGGGLLLGLDTNCTKLATDGTPAD